ncbi:MAG: alpha/beta fold hydrolase [Hahellaceae bacterium]|nr:alpha/beta fold hydrolase [Hahellaceae bacterium]MCP5168353.1 alpha/beta fold hydrolase [Hahellaceae bacterium]
MREFTVNHLDVELYVQVHGDANQPTLLFLHGFPDCQQSWHHQVEALKRDYQVVTFDMRGVGQSTWSARRHAYHMDSLLADIDAVINAVVGHDGQVHLVGHDWGSVIGWSFISDAGYARRVLSYTSMSGPHLALMLDWAKRNLQSATPTGLAGALRQGLFSWYVYLFNVPVLPEVMFKLVGQPLWQWLLKSNGVAADDTYLNASQKEVENICLNPINLYRQNPLNPPEVPAASSIHVPVQLIIPRGDRFISDQLFEFYDEYVVNLRRHFIEGKHWAHHSHKEDFNRLVKQFVDTVEQQQSRAA